MVIVKDSWIGIGISGASGRSLSFISYIGWPHRTWYDTFQSVVYYGGWHHSDSQIYNFDDPPDENPMGSHYMKRSIHLPV